MRIVLYQERSWPYFGGIETAGLARAQRMRELGHEVWVLSGTQDEGMPPEEEYRGIPILRLPLTAALERRDPAAIFELRSRYAETMERLRPDVVHASFAGPAIFFPLMHRRRSEIPLVVSLHGTWDRYRTDPGTIMRRALEEADHVVAVSSAVEDQLRSQDLRFNGGPTTITNGIAPPAEDPGPVPRDPPRLLCVGRLTWEKGFDRAVAALPRIRERLPDAVLTIAGDGLEREPLRDLAAELGITEAVRMPGWVSPAGVSELLAETTLMVVPSVSEGFGNAALEGMAMGRPVVAARVGGLPEVLGDAGVLVDDLGPERLASVILDLLVEGDLDGIGRRARAHAIEHHSLDRTVARYLELFEELRGDDG